MFLRPNQETAVDKVLAALQEHGNTLLVAPTGFGKTITMAGISERRFRDGANKLLTMQHRDELAGQNLEKFRRFTDGRISVSLFDASTKSFRGRSVFGMVQTLSKNLKRIPKLDDILIDEAHHAPSRTYQEVIAAGRDKNKDMGLVGVTATPVRGDRKTLAKTFNNVAHVVEMGDLIANGYLVPPVTYKPKVGDVRGLVNSVKRGDAEFDMEEAAGVMDQTVVTSEVIAHWKRLAGSRKTIVFCTNVTHAIHVAEEWQRAGYRTGLVHSKMPKKERVAQLLAYSRGETQILVNVMVLTEGFDDQPTSCVVILRPAAYRSTFIQIVGRGLRKVDPILYPGLVKSDCIVLDFCSNHSSLEQDISEAFLKEKKKGVLADKVCPNCAGEIPARAKECYLCGHEFPYVGPDEKKEAHDVDMIEVDLLSQSKMAWVDLFENGRSLMASGFKAWAVIVQADPDQDVWCSLGSKNDENGIASRPIVLEAGGRSQCLASAHDWMSCHETNKKAGKDKSWVSLPASTKQLKYIERIGRWDASGGMTKYAASCRIDYQNHEAMIINAVNQGLGHG